MRTFGRSPAGGVLFILLMVLVALLVSAGCSGNEKDTTPVATPVPTAPPTQVTQAGSNALHPGDVVRGTNITETAWLVLKYYPSKDQYAVIEVQKIDVRLPDRWTKGYMPVNVRATLEQRARIEQNFPVRVESINLTDPCPDIGSSDLICGTNAARFIERAEITPVTTRPTQPPATATPVVQVTTAAPLRATAAETAKPTGTAVPGPFDDHKFNPGDIDSAGDLTLYYDNTTGYYFYAPVRFSIETMTWSPGKSMVPQKMERDRYEATIVANGAKRSKIAHFEEADVQARYSAFKARETVRATSTGQKPFYRTGDIVNEAPWISPGWLISSYDQPSDSYHYMPVFPYENATYGYNYEKSYSQVGQQNRPGLEANLPYLVGHINMTDLYTIRPE